MKRLTALFILSTLSLSTLADNSAKDLLFARQWSLKNSGQILLKSVGELERDKKGTAGIDLNWVNPSSLNLNETSAKEIVVAVIDTGLDINHPDLKDRVWFNEKLCKDLPQEKREKVGCFGWNFIYNNANIADDVGHGTHVAGLIAANNNNIGIAGVTHPRVKIMPLKVLDAQVTSFMVNGKVFTDIVAEAVTYAVKNGAQVINLSMGWARNIDNAKVRQAFKYAEQNNVLVVAATSNNKKDLPAFPCAYESVICVGSIDNTRSLTDFTNYGPKIDVVAPGEGMISTYPQNLESRILRIKDYESKKGSSQASPLVAGVAATLKLLKPTLRNDEIKAILYKTSKDTYDVENKILFGQVNMGATISALESSVQFFAPVVKENSELKIADYRNIDYRLRLKKYAYNAENSSEANQVEVCLQGNDSIEVFNLCQNIVFGADEVVRDIPFQLIAKDIFIDSHQNLKINLKYKNGFYSFPVTLIFSRDIENSQELRHSVIEGINANDMLEIGNGILSAKLRPVTKLPNSGPMFFGSEKNLQTTTNTTFNIYSENDGSVSFRRFTLPKLTSIQSIHERDVDMNGTNDLVFIGKAEKSAQDRKVILGFFNRDGSPLFKNGQHIWIYDINTVNNLLDSSGKEKFQWLKIKSDLFGTILIPAFLKRGGMPENDNVKNILDRFTGEGNHLYFLNPILKDGKVTTETRAVDSVSMRKKYLSEVTDIEDLEVVQIDQLLPQTEDSKANGEIKALLSLQTQSLGDIFLMKTSGTNFSFQKVTSTITGLNQSVLYPVINDAGKASNEVIFSALTNKNATRNSFFNIHTNEENETLNFKTKSFDDIVINLLAGYRLSDQRAMLFFENRYSISVYDGASIVSELPVYRDSSFPGVSFSEFLTPILMDDAPGLFVNSTYIFGDRLYVAQVVNGEFLRPIQNSIAIPKSCAQLGVVTEGNKSEMAFVCSREAGKVELQFLALKKE